SVARHRHKPSHRKPFRHMAARAGPRALPRAGLRGATGPCGAGLRGATGACGATGLRGATGACAVEPANARATGKSALQMALVCVSIGKRLELGRNAAPSANGTTEPTQIRKGTFPGTYPS